MVRPCDLVASHVLIIRTVWEEKNFSVLTQNIVVHLNTLLIREVFYFSLTWEKYYFIWVVYWGVYWIPVGIMMISGYRILIVSPSRLNIVVHAVHVSRYTSLHTGSCHTSLSRSNPEHTQAWREIRIRINYRSNKCETLDRKLNITFLPNLVTPPDLQEVLRFL